MVGADRVMLGTDFPFDRSDPIGLLDSTDGLSDTDPERIKGGNATGLFAIRFVAHGVACSPMSGR